MKGENRHIHIFGGKIFQAEKRASAKALQQSGKEACRMGTQLMSVAQLVKNQLAMRETWVQTLGQEDPLEKGKGKNTHSSILTQRIPWTVQFMGLQRVGHN